MDSQTLIKLYEQGRRDFSGINLADVDLSYAYLRGINLANACLTNANLVGVNLTSANLTGINLNNAKITSAYLGDADLRTADLSQANFSYSYLAETNLTSSYLLQTNFSHTYLSRAMLMKTNAIESDFTKSNLSKANLIKADLSGAIFSYAYLTKSNLSQANFKLSTLHHTNLIGCQAFGTIFEKANLTGACIEDWLINEKTNFTNTACDYIYLRYDWINDCFESRLPYNSQQKFQPGEFEYLQVLEKTRTVINLNFNQGIDWQVFMKTWDAFLTYLKNQNNEDLSLEIQSIEKKRDGTLRIGIDVPSNMDKLAVSQWFLNQYNNILKYKIQLLLATNKIDEQTIKYNLYGNINITNIIRKISG